MTLDLSPYIVWDSKNWIRPGAIFLLKKNNWFDSAWENPNGGLYVVANTPVLFLHTRIRKSERLDGSVMVCHYKFLIEENTYVFRNSFTCSTNYAEFNGEDTELMTKVFYEYFESIENCLGKL